LFRHWLTQTFIAGLRCDGLTAPWVIGHPIIRETLDTFIEIQHAPTLQPGDMVSLNNLPSHKRAKAEAILKQRRACLLFQPPYSPDLNPVDRALSSSRPILGCRRTDHRRALVCHRRHLRSLPRAAVLELLQSRSMRF